MNVRSSKEIIHRVFRIFNPKDGSWVANAVDSIDEAVQAIGTPFGLSPAEATVEIKNFRGPLPCHLEYVDYVTDNCGNRVFHNNDIGIFTDMGSSASMHGYKIEPGYIKAPFATGELIVHYHKIPRDKQGLPAVINMYEYIEAVTWLVVSHMILAGHKHPEVNYDKADRKWESFRTKAQNHLMMPSPDDMETISNMWLNNRQDVDYAAITAELYPTTTP